jgi:hypothetical protein
MLKDETAKRLVLLMELRESVQLLDAAGKEW